jgi:mycothiol synthase
MTSPQITRAALSRPQVTAVLDLVQACQAADGVTPLSEHVLLHLRYDSTAAGPTAAGTTAADSTGAPEPDGAPGQDFVLTVDGELAGYACLDPPAADPHSGTTEVSGELMIGPDHRRHGLGRALVAEAAAAVDAAGGGHALRLWAHGDLPAAAALATATGFERFRALWQLRRPLGESARPPLAEPALPAGRALRTFVPGQDEDEWLALNARAFAKHPEQGGWTRHDLELREREPWFDPAGFFVATKDGVMTGFHWTKVHPPEPDAAGPATGPGPESPGPESPGLGEVYVVGVDPAEQGSGLGRALTLAGLHHLRDRGVVQAMLYVDEDNVPAIRMYEALGFTRAKVDAMYRRPPGN